MTESGSSQQSMVEKHHIDYVDPSERRGRARDLFPVWFSANLNIGGAVFGAIAVALGNNVFWALVAVLLGNLLGGTFMALHSVQGARLGVPQLIQSRGQFGFYGALIPVALAALLYAGFFTVTAVIGGQALSAATSNGMSVNQGVLVCVAVSLLLALLGYGAIHTAPSGPCGRWPPRWSSPHRLHRPGRGLLHHGRVRGRAVPERARRDRHLPADLRALRLDYSRYLPEDTSAKGAFAATFGGAFLGTTWSRSWVSSSRCRSPTPTSSPRSGRCWAPTPSPRWSCS
jgi:NCS1 family nucleobase:cation symporter-1